MTYELEISEEADLEITNAYLYYEDKQAGLGERFLTPLEIYLIKISQNPKHFEVKRRNYREAYLRMFPYVIIFEIDGSKIMVYSVLNTPQKPNKKTFITTIP